MKDTLRVIGDLRARVAESRVIIATNDNTDDTDAVLAGYENQAPGFEVIRLDGLMDKPFDRIERIATARNATLEALFSGPVPHGHTLVLDLDGPNANLDLDPLLATFNRAEEWDALFANQDGAYYDIYALRCPGWCEADVWQQIWNARKKRWFRRRPGLAALEANYIHSIQYSIPPDLPPIPVDSAFGGLGLYRTELLRGQKYAARDAKGEVTCEHVTLNAGLRMHGARLFIAPNLINATQPGHLSSKSGKPFPNHLYPDRT